MLLSYSGGKLHEARFLLNERISESKEACLGPLLEPGRAK